jgi:hypothetical protein
MTSILFFIRWGKQLGYFQITTQIPEDFQCTWCSNAYHSATMMRRMTAMVAALPTKYRRVHNARYIMDKTTLIPAANQTLILMPAPLCIFQPVQHTGPCCGVPPHIAASDRSGVACIP